MNISTTLLAVAFLCFVMGTLCGSDAKFNERALALGLALWLLSTFMR